MLNLCFDDINNTSILWISHLKFVMFVTQLWAVQSYPVEKENLGVTLDTSEDVLYAR